MIQDLHLHFDDTYPIRIAHRTSSVLVLVNVFEYKLLTIFPTLVNELDVPLLAEISPFDRP